MKWKWFPRRISLQIAVMVLITTATFQVVMTLAAYITEIAQPSHQRLMRKDFVEQLVEVESSLDRDSLERAVERLFPPPCGRQCTKWVLYRRSQPGSAWLPFRL